MFRGQMISAGDGVWYGVRLNRIKHSPASSAQSDCECPISCSGKAESGKEIRGVRQHWRASHFFTNRYFFSYYGGLFLNIENL